MANVIGSGASSDLLTIDPTSKAARVLLYDANGRAIAHQSKNTFFAAGNFTPAATPTDLVTIFGSATKTVRVYSMRIGTTNTAAGSQIFLLIKRSGVNTAGTFVAATAVNADSTDAAASATVGHYTANPTGLGAVTGNVNYLKVASPVPVPTSFAGIVEGAQFEMIPMADSGLSIYKPIVLSGTGQGLAINFNGAALVAGQIHHYNIVWTEE